MVHSRRDLLWAAIQCCSIVTISSARHLDSGNLYPRYQNDSITTTSSSSTQSSLSSSTDASSTPSSTSDSVVIPSTTYPNNITTSLPAPNTTSDYYTTVPCTTLSPGEDMTVWSILPNPTTYTVTVGVNYSTSALPSSVSEFTPPVYCPPTWSSSAEASVSTSTRLSLGHPPPPVSEPTLLTSEPTRSPHFSTFSPPGEPGMTFTRPAGTTTIITTSKNPVTKTVTPRVPVYPGAGNGDKVSVTPTPAPSAPPPVFLTLPNPPQSQPPQGGPPAPSPSPVVNGSPEPVLNNPTPTGGSFRETPTPTVIQGVPVQLAPDFVVISGTTFNIGPGASPKTITANGQIISIGPAGLEFPQTTVAPFVSQPTNVVILDGEVISAVGASIAVIGGSTFTYNAGSSPQTTVFNHETITIGPAGISFDGTTLGGQAHPTGTQLGIAGGVSITEVGSSLAVITGTSVNVLTVFTFTIGPGATQTTATIDNRTITADQTGVGIDGQTITFPFNPTTQAITAGGITFTEIGSTVVIGGSTYTIGPGAKPTTISFNSETISIGPGGVGFSTTTFVSATSAPAATTTASKKNGVERLRPVYGFSGTCVVMLIGYFMGI